MRATFHAISGKDFEYVFNNEKCKRCNARMMNERSSPRHEDPQRQTRCKRPWEWGDSESKFTTHICRSSNSAPLLIELSRQQLLTKICQVSALFNFSPNALQHGSLSCQDWSGHLLCSVLALFLLSCLKCVLSHLHFFVLSLSRRPACSACCESLILRGRRCDLQRRKSCSATETAHNACSRW